MTPKVSIVIPVYNVEKYILQCLKSVAMQTYDNLEVLIIDDQSPDGGIDLAKKFIVNYLGDKKFTIITHAKNRGVSGARNTGIKQSTGEYLFFIDSDDWLGNPNTIQLLVDEALKTDATITTANSMMIDDITGKIYKVVDEDYKNEYSTNDNPNIVFPLHGVVWNILIKRSYIIEHDLYFDEGILWEDTLWIFKLNSLGPSVATIGTKTYMYRCRQGSIMTTLREKHIVSYILLPLLAHKYMKSHKIAKIQYAKQSIEDLKFGALKMLITKTTSPELYNQVYDIYRDNISGLPMVVFLKAKASTKFRLIHNYLPRFIGRIYEHILLKLYYRNHTDKKLSANLEEIVKCNLTSNIESLVL